MTGATRNLFMFGLMAALLTLVGFTQSWDVSLALLNMCIISAIMALGVNIQWGYAGLFNVGTMGFAALGGLAAMLVSVPPVTKAWSAGGFGILGGLVAGLITIVVGLAVWRRTRHLGRRRYWLTAIVVLVGYMIMRAIIHPAVEAIEAVDASKTGFLGGLGMPIIFSWFVGGVFAAGAAWVVGKISLGLRSDYLAIATLGISEIIIYFLKFEDWLTRGVKNVNGLVRPVPYEVDLNQSPAFREWATGMGFDVATAASITVKLCYAGLFAVVLLIVLYLSEVALRSPWGRMMRAIRDNETAAAAMGKNVTSRHLQVFILGSAVVGVAGAMLTTLDGQFTPVAYQPLRFTFLIWVMVIIGGSGNNWGAVLGGFIIWFFWIEAEPIGLWLMGALTSGMAPDHWLRLHLIESAAHMRLLTMGLVLLLVLRFAPRGLIPEVKR
ncbi:MAG: branched-chain amino acid ABC transporter permease [Pseudomonadota bacterium]|nr:branched-chain amino acid ABC transporter permease [Pseudomonadota bacterium]MEC7238264.1 branched-chain amino acid ABC transporter permease [Pseudomonadota bacterium]